MDCCSWRHHERSLRSLLRRATPLAVGRRLDSSILRNYAPEGHKPVRAWWWLWWLWWLCGGCVVVVGGCWWLLVVGGGCWWLLVVVGGCWWLLVRTWCSKSVSVHAHARVQLIKRAGASAPVPSAGLTSRNPLRLFPPKAGSVRSRVQNSPNPESRKRIARSAHLTLHSFGGRGGQSFPSPRRWMPQIWDTV